jgi:hypothetical protein
VPSNYFALICTDGDSLGQALNGCKTLAKIRDVANGIDDILRMVKDEALLRHGVESHQADTLLHGGDDLMLAVPAHKALALALDINEGFHQHTQQRLGTAYTLSTAIVWAHATFPFGVWHDIAESTLKFAKREGARWGHKGLINFLAISSSNHLEFETFYDKVLCDGTPDGRQIVRTLRPYTAERLRNLITYRNALRRLPRSKLAALHQAVFQPPRRAMFEALRLLVHWRGEATRQSIQKLVPELVEAFLREERPGKVGTTLFPFIEVKDDIGADNLPVTTYYTPLVDLAEIWDFLPGGQDEA